MPHTHDIVSLFTSIPQGLAVEMMNELLESKNNEMDETVKWRHLIQLLKFCLKTNFTSEGTTYEQVKGTPMGSQLSGFIVEAVLQKVETLIFANYKKILEIYPSSIVRGTFADEAPFLYEVEIGFQPLISCLFSSLKAASRCFERLVAALQLCRHLHRSTIEQELLLKVRTSLPPELKEKALLSYPSTDTVYPNKECLLERR
ncbi:unnamed protein product [Schistocephalus solidus]|uniref:Reverse transcriptase domain-containing protein n=1 Tax=Schistocephalus solidus TaxID=70667 RepID=A0A183T0J3_SCHSO|nr:unnamed protein product [Schistocephalus solidus]